MSCRVRRHTITHDPEHADMPDGVGNQWPAIPDVPAL
jgi:hypothetical protein